MCPWSYTHPRSLLAGEGTSIDLYTLASSLKDEGLELPLLFRFPDIVSHRLHLLQARDAIRPV
jgi:arginine decarboxylase-like protein